MKIQTTRFGEMSVNTKDLITFSNGILGFDGLKKFFIVDPCDDTLILWLQSTENPSIAFPLIEPKIFCPDYKVHLVSNELESLALNEIGDAQIYSILTIPRDVHQMTANLKAPVIINSESRKGRQIILQDSKLGVRFPMYKELKTYVSGRFSDDQQRTSAGKPKVKPPKQTPEVRAPREPELNN